MDLHNVKITNGSPAGCSTEIMLDGEPLKGVTDIKMSINIENRTEIAVTFIPESIDIGVDAQVVALQPKLSDDQKTAETTDMPSNARKYATTVQGTSEMEN